MLCRVQLADALMKVVTVGVTEYPAVKVIAKCGTRNTIAVTNAENMLPFSVTVAILHQMIQVDASLQVLVQGISAYLITVLN